MHQMPVKLKELPSLYLYTNLVGFIFVQK